MDVDGIPLCEVKRARNILLEGSCMQRDPIKVLAQVICILGVAILDAVIAEEEEKENEPTAE